jgi:5-methylcytosine-specific restriction endonuclease McrA
MRIKVKQPPGAWRVIDRYGICLICKKFYHKDNRHPDSRLCNKSCSGRYNSRTRSVPKRTEEWNKKIGDAQRGELARNWRGGVTPLNKKGRLSSDYRKWRKAVFERDDYTCQRCKVRGGILHADHIKPYAKYPQLRYDLGNGRTLCLDCHKKTPTWGRTLRYL